MNYGAWLDSHGIDSTRVEITDVEFNVWGSLDKPNGTFCLNIDHARITMIFETIQNPENPIEETVLWCIELDNMCLIDEIHTKTIKAIQENHKSFFM